MPRAARFFPAARPQSVNRSIVRSIVTLPVGNSIVLSRDTIDRASKGSVGGWYRVHLVFFSDAHARVFVFSTDERSSSRIDDRQTRDTRERLIGALRMGFDPGTVSRTEIQAESLQRRRFLFREFRYTLRLSTHYNFSG